MMQVSDPIFFVTIFIEYFVLLKFYFRGVAHPRRVFCNPQGLNHGVLLVGYGVEHKSKMISFFLI
jgi:hypothetical protein